MRGDRSSDGRSHNDALVGWIVWSTTASSSAEGAQVVAALQQLSPDQREVMLLSVVVGLTAPEVATAVGKTVGEVKALRHRGLAALAEVLDLRSSY